jgi:Dyp-type peroxidase family
MPEGIDLFDIQGNIVKAYGRFKFSRARYIFYRIHKEVEGRNFVKSLLTHITTSEAWDDNKLPIPKVTTNIAFTYSGLKHLGLPRQSLQSFPEEFVMGMKARRAILGDDGPSAPETWDSIWNNEDEQTKETDGWTPIWQDETPVDVWISINGSTLEIIEERYQLICGLVAQSKGGVEQLTGHSGPNPDYQDASAVFDAQGNSTDKEHFGYADGISDPYFEGSIRNGVTVIGGGKPKRVPPGTPADSIDSWEPLETGEFILGYRDESKEYPIAPKPHLLAYNGAFMVYRKLHENVGSFNRYLEEVGAQFPEGKEALAAKFAGRWRNGAPLALFPTEKEANDFMTELHKIEVQRDEIKTQLETATGAEKKRLEQEKKALDDKFYPMRSKLVGFNYNDDLSGSKCPIGSHIRRINPRGALEMGKVAFDAPGALDDRRRMLRRGIPYGEVKDPTRDDGDHGLIFVAVMASIKRQFEFVQQQWVNYGNDFHLANDKDPLLGNHEITADGQGKGRMVIEAAKAKAGETQKPPFFCSNLTRFVETRGGDYFFIPSMTALRMIAEGIIDPT